MKTILVDGINGLIYEDGSLFQRMYELLEKYPNKKIIVTGANDEQFDNFKLGESPYEVFTLKHNPEKTSPLYFELMLNNYGLMPDDVIYFEHSIEAVKSAESLGIKTYHYDHTKEDLAALKRYIEMNI